MEKNHIYLINNLIIIINFKKLKMSLHNSNSQKILGLSTPTNTFLFKTDFVKMINKNKIYSYKKQGEIKPDYWCRKFNIDNPDQNPWINYNSHELVGLSDTELEENYYKIYPELRKVLDPLFHSEHKD